MIMCNLLGVIARRRNFRNSWSFSNLLLLSARLLGNKILLLRNLLSNLDLRKLHLSIVLESDKLILRSVDIADASKELLNLSNVLLIASLHRFRDELANLLGALLKTTHMLLSMIKHLDRSLHCMLGRLLASLLSSLPSNLLGHLLLGTLLSGSLCRSLLSSSLRCSKLLCMLLQPSLRMMICTLVVSGLLVHCFFLCCLFCCFSVNR